MLVRFGVVCAGLNTETPSFKSNKNVGFLDSVTPVKAIPTFHKSEA
jgi:hypothetical protein